MLGYSTQGAAAAAFSVSTFLKLHHLNDRRINDAFTMVPYTLQAGSAAESLLNEPGPKKMMTTMYEFYRKVRRRKAESEI